MRKLKKGILAHCHLLPNLRAIFRNVWPIFIKFLHKSKIFTKGSYGFISTRFDFQWKRDFRKAKFLPRGISGEILPWTLGGDLLIPKYGPPPRGKVSLKFRKGGIFVFFCKILRPNWLML